MAHLNGVLKAVETLNGLLELDTPSDPGASRKEKVSCCAIIVEGICSPTVRQNTKFPQILSATIETLLALCNDDESDVRMVADESLNKIIRAMVDSNIVKIQIELYNEIKRNGPARILRAALWRFGLLSHMIRPSRGKAYVSNLVPCIVIIAHRSEDTSRTLENVAMIDQCERVFAEPINSAIKKSQSSPLTQKLYWHDYQTDAHPRCTKRPLQTHRQRRLEHDRYLFRMKGDAANSELTNEDIVAYSKYARAIPVKSSIKKHRHCKQPERSPDERECSDAESEVSVKYIPRAVQSRKSRVLDPELRRRYVGIGDGEYVAETRNESDVESQEMRNLVLSLEDLERMKRGDGEATISEDDKRLERRKPENIARTVKSRKTGDAASKSSTLIGQSINRLTKELVLNEPERLTKLDLHATKTRILESIDRMLGTTDDTKNDVPVQQEQTEQESLEKITRELQENGWQLLFNGLTIHRDSTSRRIVRLECLNHIRQQLDKLYALESTLDNCPPKLQSLSSCDMARSEERQQSQHQLEQKTADS